MKDKLFNYKRKRDFAKTPEPKGEIIEDKEEE